MTTVLRNAKIYTSNEHCPMAEAIVFDGDKILFVGRDDEGEWGKYTGDSAEIRDMKGKVIIPGIIDSHIHPGMCAESGWHIRLPWTEDPQELLAFVRKYAAEHPKEEAPFLYFEYYPTSMFGTRGPTKELLDTAVSDRPCMCQDFGEHMHWYNTKMLAAMGITKDTPDPVPGLQMFVRDENGEPTGWGKELVHTLFMDKISETIGWKPPMDLTPEILGPFFSFLSDNGITAMCDGFIESGEQAESIHKLDEAGKLNVYYDGMVRFWDYGDLPEKIAVLREYERKYSTRHIKFNTMKLFLDGTNESGNSASLAPHLNDPTGENYGEIKMEKEELKGCFLLCNREGLDVHIHMVGDRAFRTGCDAVEAAKRESAENGEPWRINIVFAHCELVDPADMGRPAELGIIVNWSCHWSGGYFGEEAQAFFGKEKWSGMYQFNPMIESGALVTFSSDVVTNYELHRANPFFSMQVAATRVDPEFPLDPDRYPGSLRPPESAKLSVDHLMKGYTINGAKQLRLESEMGSLEAGKTANLLVISGDPFHVPPEKLSEIGIEAVVFDGTPIRGKL
ncbi:MAG TPA: amidohydrolase family protein [Bacillota bacterium]|nr:amidohydrolase family protein [Bacillota bacterium]